MNYWLVKADPETDYSIDDLERDGHTEWTGVHNFQAIGYIKQMKPGNLVYIYHSQKEKAIVGCAAVASEPYENKDDPRTSWAVRLQFDKKFNTTLGLKDIKSQETNKDFLLVRNPRLSVMPVPSHVNAFIKKGVK